LKESKARSTNHLQKISQKSGKKRKGGREKKKEKRGWWAPEPFRIIFFQSVLRFTNLGEKGERGKKKGKGRGKKRKRVGRARLKPVVLI